MKRESAKATNSKKSISFTNLSETDSATILPSELHKFILSNGGEVTYHSILFNFGLLSELDNKVGGKLDSRLRNNIRRSAKKLGGKNMFSRKNLEILSYSADGKRWVMFRNGNGTHGTSEQSSAKLKIVTEDEAVKLQKQGGLK